MKKHEVSRFPSMLYMECSWEDSCGWKYDGLQKSEGVFRLISLVFSAEFLLSVSSAITSTSLETK